MQFFNVCRPILMHLDLAFTRMLLHGHWPLKSVEQLQTVLICLFDTRLFHKVLSVCNLINKFYLYDKVYLVCIIFPSFSVSSVFSHSQGS